MDPNKQHMGETPRGTLSMTTKNGYGVLVTVTEKMTNKQIGELMERIDWADDHAKNYGMTPPAPKGFGGGGNTTQKKTFNRPTTPAPKETGEECPNCGSPLVEAQTPSGKRMIKCSTAGWDRVNKVATGCDYIKWLQ